MRSRVRVARALVIAGCALLIASAVLHSLAGFAFGFPALRASNLAPSLQSAFRAVFLSLAWHWVVLAAIALVAALVATRARKGLLLLCGGAVLLEAVADTIIMGWSAGGGLLGAAGVLLAWGGMPLAAPGGGTQSPPSAPS